jgi:hypothetical protein
MSRVPELWISGLASGEEGPAALVDKVVVLCV